MTLIQWALIAVIFAYRVPLAITQIRSAKRAAKYIEEANRAVIEMQMDMFRRERAEASQWLIRAK